MSGSVDHPRYKEIYARVRVIPMICADCGTRTADLECPEGTITDTPFGPRRVHAFETDDAAMTRLILDILEGR